MSIELIKRIREAIRGHETWRVMNADDSGYCMEFASPDYFNPGRACEHWLSEQNPEWIARNGYHAVRSFEYTGAEGLALEAADALEDLLAASGSRTSAATGSPESESVGRAAMQEHKP